MQVEAALENEEVAGGRGIVLMDGTEVGRRVAPVERLMGELAGMEEEAAPQPTGAVTVDTGEGLAEGGGEEGEGEEGGGEG